jgi:acetylornithine deacetylase/succinyl-diaminopimelate desuccinylase-like protein
MVRITMDTRKAIEAIDSNFERTLNKVQEFLRQPSISGTGAGINRAVNIIVTNLKKIGFETKIHSTPSNPIIFGKNESAHENAPTLIFQTSVDVMASEGEAWWSVPPFAAEIRDHPRFGPTLIARGVYTSKAILITLIKTLEILQEIKESIPLNLIIVVDTEEESGSPYLQSFVNSHKSDFAHADAVYYPFFATDRRGVARIFLGNKGIIFLRLRCKGPSTRDLHSAEVGWIRNPAHILAKALSSFVDIHGQPLIPGLLEDVQPPSDDDERLISSLAQSFDPGIAALQLEASNLSIEADSKEDLLRRFLFKPTVNISGIQTGYIGESMKTILPREASAHVDIRLTPNQNPKRVFENVKNHLANLGLADLVDIELGYMMNWAKSNDSTQISKALLKSYYDAGVDSVEIWPMFPGSVPLSVYSNPPFNLPFVIGGLGHGGHAHGRNEYVMIEGIRQFQKGLVHFLEEFSQSSKTGSESSS